MGWALPAPLASTLLLLTTPALPGPARPVLPLHWPLPLLAWLPPLLVEILALALAVVLSLMFDRGTGVGRLCVGCADGWSGVREPVVGSTSTQASCSDTFGVCCGNCVEATRSKAQQFDYNDVSAILSETRPDLSCTLHCLELCLHVEACKVVLVLGWGPCALHMQLLHSIADRCGTLSIILQNKQCLKAVRCKECKRLLQNEQAAGSIS